MTQPTPKTVILVDGFLFKGFLTDVAIVKSLQAAGYEAVQFNYNNDLPTTDNIQTTAQGVRDMALSKGGEVVFVGVSMGAQVLCALLRLVGTQVLGPWSFILLGNPEHVVTGRVKSARYGGLGIPDNTPYAVTDLAAQYDFWADAPNTMWSWLGADANSLAIGNGIHCMGYFNLDPALPYPYVQRGNIRDMWAPYTPTLWNRYFIELGYNRPVKL